MKMRDRRLKRLDKLGTQINRKTSLTGRPTNRAERRKFEHVLRQTQVDPAEVDQDALFEALKKHHGEPTG
jgi:hypothetical protein